ncbi:MAG TPA: phosphoribosyl-AMP cyclohydrolase [Ktedonobacteraceae bacterium]
MLKFDRQGLVPAVIQDATSQEVLLVAFMNEEALRLTRETGQTHFFSRSRNKIWHKGEQSGNVQEVRAIFINCEENSLLIRVVQHGDAACHEGYVSCYYRRLQPDDSYETVAERLFDPAVVYANVKEQPMSAEQNIPLAEDSITPELEKKLEAELRQLYGVYLYLRDHDLSEESNTSRLLQEHSQSYLVSRLADELQELADVQTGEHIHSGRKLDTVLEGSQVGYWLFLIAAGLNVPYNDFTPHDSLLAGYRGQYSDAKAIEQRQECLSLISSEQATTAAQGLHLGFAQIGWASASAGINPLEPAEYDLDQMRRKGLVK